MPLPAFAAVVWGVLELITVATTAYDLYDLSKTLYDGVGDFNANKEKAKEYVRQIMQSFKDEVAGDIDKNWERQLLVRLSQADLSKQSEATRKVTGRTGEGGNLIKTAIPMPMPFREQLTQICDLADKTPVISLRRKKGVQVKDLPQAKKKILLELLEIAIEEEVDADSDSAFDLDDFIVVRLKQLMVSHLLEFMDELLDWKSPMKTEACFGPDTPRKPATTFADPKLQGTKLERMGSSFNPFYPLPHRKWGAIAADVVIPDYRQDPLTKANLFGIVEIKFPGDVIKNKQFEQYKKLSEACGAAKTLHVGQANTLEGKGVTIGTRVCLLRYPEDRAVEPEDKESERKPSRKKGNEKRS